MKSPKYYLVLAGLVAAAFVAPMLFQTTRAQGSTTSGAPLEKPRIQITVVPELGEGPDSNGTIAGTVSNVDATTCKIILFSLTDQWWVQPTAASPLTDIVDGKWEADIHLGREYSAVLVRLPYTAPATLPKGRFPPSGSAVLAVARTAAKKN